MEFEQEGARKANYGSQVLKKLGEDLSKHFGRGFSWRNLYLMRNFYLAYPNILQTSSAKCSSQKGQLQTAGFLLSWSHYVRLLSLSDSDKRDFYEAEARRAGWSVRQLERQIDSSFYERLSLSRRRKAVRIKALMGAAPSTPEEEIKDPYVLEFLGLPEPLSEKDLENALVDHLMDFLLEMEFGFAFVARQKRLQVGSASYHLDLLLYHRRLRCLVAIDLKMGRFNHSDAGQMNLYLNYLCENETIEGENSPIGLILCAEKDEAVARYALGGLSNRVFASRYRLELPDPKVLGREVAAERRRLEKKVRDERCLEKQSGR